MKALTCLGNQCKCSDEPQSILRWVQGTAKLTASVTHAAEDKGVVEKWEEWMGANLFRQRRRRCFSLFLHISCKWISGFFLKRIRWGQRSVCWGGSSRLWKGHWPEWLPWKPLKDLLLLSPMCGHRTSWHTAFQSWWCVEWQTAEVWRQFLMIVCSLFWRALSCGISINKHYWHDSRLFCRGFACFFYHTMHAKLFLPRFSYDVY